VSDAAHSPRCPPLPVELALPVAVPDELLRTGRRAAAPNAKWLQNLTQFGPAPPARPLVGSAFDAADPVTPAWLEQLQSEWVDPTVFLDLWRPDWEVTFKPLYVTGCWQRLWRAGKGCPRQGYFVRENLLFKVGSYSDRLCVPCPEARVEILRRLHDSALAGHCGRHKTAARV